MSLSDNRRVVEQVAQGVHVIELQGGKIVRETDYFSQPFEAPEWRAEWVERM